MEKVPFLSTPSSSCSFAPVVSHRMPRTQRERERQKDREKERERGEGDGARSCRNGKHTRHAIENLNRFHSITFSLQLVSLKSLSQRFVRLHGDDGVHDGRH